jgi:hypothetical protein
MALMLRARYGVTPVFFLVFTACASASPEGSNPAHSSSSAGSGVGGAGGAGGASDAGMGGASPEAGTGAPCSVDGAPGQCLEVSACAALPGYTSTPGYCPGPADIECCMVTPSVADDPPTPAGYELMMQSEVTAAMTAWAVEILDDPTGYPLFSTTTMTFGTLLVLALVEWHPPDFQNSVVHRGVTLYQPI